MVFPGKAYVNFENPEQREFAKSDPKGFLVQYGSGAVLDEIQRVPEFPSYLQTIVDERKTTGQFILTGSQQFEVMNTITQSLAGRTALLKLLPFSVEELKVLGPLPSLNSLILTGFYPRIYDGNLNPTQALGDYFETYVERDLRQLVAVKDLSLFRKFVRLCAGRVGQLLNLQSLGNDAGVSHTTARAWISLLEASYIVFLMPPWYKNISQRQVKSSKLYFYDVGLASYLLGLENEKQVSRDPLRGNLFENMIVTEFLKHRFNGGRKNNLYFYRDKRGVEVDLLFETASSVFPVEIKAGATVASDYFDGLKAIARVFPKMPKKGAVIYGGDQAQLRSDFPVYPVTDVGSLLSRLEVDNDPLS